MKYAIFFCLVAVLGVCCFLLLKQPSKDNSSDLRPAVLALLKVRADCEGNAAKDELRNDLAVAKAALDEAEGPDGRPSKIMDDLREAWSQFDTYRFAAEMKNYRDADGARALAVVALDDARRRIRR